MTSELYMKIHNTQKFSGLKDESWETWIFRFETRFSELDEANLATVLLDVLDGTVLDVCGKLGRDERKSYKNLKGALQKKFGANVDPRRANAELRQVRQQPGEGTEAFADRVRKLTNIANPGLSSTQLDQAALEHFLCGLSDRKLQEKLHNNDAVLSLQQAIQVAQKVQEKETTLTVMRTLGGQDTQSVMPSSYATVSEGQRNMGDNRTDTTEVLAMIGELRDEIREVKAQMKRGTSRTPSAINNGNRRGCFQCGDTRHFKRNCPQLFDRHQRGQVGPPGATPGTPVTRGAAKTLQCFGCGRIGHSIAECWRTPVSAGGLGLSSTPQSMENVKCLNCGRQGHWAADCWKQTGGRGPQYPAGPHQNMPQGNGH